MRVYAQDLTPTWWGLAGIDFGANDVDGKSLVPLLIDRNQVTRVSKFSGILSSPNRSLPEPPPIAQSEASLPESVARHLASSKQSAATWRDNVFIEYYFVGINEKCSQRHPIEAIDNNFIALRCHHASHTCMLARASPISNLSREHYQH